MNKETMDIRFIALNGIAVAVISASFTFFRGSANIFNALFVTLVIYMVTVKYKKKEILLSYGFILIFSMIFFSIQMFFVNTYFLLAIAVVFLEKTNTGRIIFVTAISMTAAVMFFLSVILTDFVFGTNINSVLEEITGNNNLRYAVLFILEGFFAGTLLYFMKEKVRKTYSASLRKQ